MKRRSLLQAGLSLATVPLAPPPSAAPPSAPPPAKVTYGRVVTRVGTNHGHVLTVSLADVDAGVGKTYDLAGTAGHTHSVTLDPAALARLRAGEIVRLPSTRDGHLHRLLVKLAPAVDPPEAASVCEITIGGKDDHELVITAADIAAGAERTYDIQGVPTHTHTVRLTGADFEKLARSEQVVVTSSPAAPDEDHTHVVFIRHPAARPRGG